MLRIDGYVQHYAWGSATALPSFLGKEATGEPWAELWFGAHPLDPSFVESHGVSLDHAISAEPRRMLGDAVLRVFGTELPFLLKIIAPAQPLSLQVHPTREHAQESFAAENAAGLSIDSPDRNYRDANHKPEMVLALEPFEALCGFRTPRKAAAMLDGLDTPLAARMRTLIADQPSAHGIRAVFRMLVSPTMAPSSLEIIALARACEERLDAGASPSVRIDRTVAMLHSKYPGDAGVAAALLLNPVSLQPGEAMFVPAGAIHSYLSGLAVEIMASSDNVLRAGLTPKKVDANELLQCVSVKAAPPLRVAPEHLTEKTMAYFAPIDDFELSVTTLDESSRSFYPATVVPGGGPRILLCLDGDFIAETSTGRHRASKGDALFVPAYAGQLRIGGHGTLVQASVP